MITERDLANASPSQLPAMHNELIVQRMKLDKFFSVFLDKYEMDMEDTESPEWFTYKEMLKTYRDVQHLIKTSEYYISHRV